MKVEVLGAFFIRRINFLRRQIHFKLKKKKNTIHTTRHTLINQLSFSAFLIFCPINTIIVTFFTSLGK